MREKTKQYEAPEMMVLQVKPASVICTSGNEQYLDGGDPWNN